MVIFVQGISFRARCKTQRRVPQMPLKRMHDRYRNLKAPVYQPESSMCKPTVPCVWKRYISC